MTLGELIAMLERADHFKVCATAFHHPHSWRGSYGEVAFEPTTNRTVGEMLEDARSALGTTYEGWKGGNFTMREHTEVHIARIGVYEDLLGEYGVRWMLASGEES